MASIVERLEEWMNHEKLNPNRLSEILGYKSGEKIYRLFRDEKAKPSIDIIEDISNKFEYLDIEWLMTGRGNMLKIPSKTAHIPPSTDKKEGFLSEKKHKAPLPQSTFGRKFGRNLAGNEDKNETSISEKDSFKDAIISAKDELIEAIKMDNKLMEKLIAEKDKRIAMLIEQIEQLQQVSATKNKKAG